MLSVYVVGMHVGIFFFGIQYDCIQFYRLVGGFAGFCHFLLRYACGHAFSWDSLLAMAILFVRRGHVGSCLREKFVAILVGWDVAIYV